jgi:signal transduction histidine kinase
VPKYAEATCATIRLHAEKGSLVLSVQDDGRGFDAVRTPKGAGLQNMSDRLAALGGTLEVRSEPGAGTEVIGRIPVKDTS